MKASCLACTIVLGIASAAYADERTTTVSVGGVGLVEDTMSDYEMQTVGGPRLTLSFEEAPLPYPDHRGYNTGFSLVPELIAGAFVEDQRAVGMLGAGLRAEFRISQREGGLLRINAKSALYVAARGLVVGEDRDVLGELVFGDYLYVGGPVRFGFEVGVSKRQSDAMPQDPYGMVFQFYLGRAVR